MREPITLGSKTFKSKLEASKFVRKLMESYQDNQPFTGEDLNIVMDVIRRYPNVDEKIGLGVKNIYLKVGQGSDRYFVIERIDRTWKDSGYKGAFYPKSDLKRFEDACRQVVSEETSGKLAFPFGKPEGFEVHHVKQFKDIVDEFIGLYNIDISQVKYKKKFNRTSQFEDEKLGHKFMEYCHQFAVLRLMSVIEHKHETAKQRRSKGHGR